MRTRRLKTHLLKLFGDQAMAYVQGIRFFYLLKRRPNPDPEVAFLDRMLEKGDVAVDVGANGADWTYYMYRHVGHNGHIFAFEADPYYALSTAITIRLLRLKNVKFFSFGLSDQTQELFLRIRNSSGERLSGRGFIDKNADPSEEGVVRVELRTLDSLVEQHPKLLKTALIKCDVEGYELFVLRGGQEIIDKARPIAIIEVGSNLRGYEPQDLYNFFRHRDYLAFAVTKSNLFRLTDDQFRTKSAHGVNRVLVPRERVSEFDDLIEKGPSPKVD